MQILITNHPVHPAFTRSSSRFLPTDQQGKFVVTGIPKVSHYCKGVFEIQQFDKCHIICQLRLCLPAKSHIESINECIQPNTTGRHEIVKRDASIHSELSVSLVSCCFVRFLSRSLPMFQRSVLSVPPMQILTVGFPSWRSSFMRAHDVTCWARISWSIWNSTLWAGYW